MDIIKMMQVFVGNLLILQIQQTQLIYKLWMLWQYHQLHQLKVEDLEEWKILETYYKEDMVI